MLTAIIISSVLAKPLEIKEPDILKVADLPRDECLARRASAGSVGVIQAGIGAALATSGALSSIGGLSWLGFVETLPGAHDVIPPTAMAVVGALVAAVGSLLLYQGHKGIGAALLVDCGTPAPVVDR